MIEGNHTFVVCAYKENAYLENCVKSVVNQTLKSKVIISTSTPNDFISNVANKYNLEVYVNKGVGNQADNFNFAYSLCKTKYVTICHQDDYYSTDYLERLNSLVTEDFVIAFTDYAEVRGEDIVENNKILNIKRIMLNPLKSKVLQKIRFVRRRILGFGNPICCPSIMYDKEKVPQPQFDMDYKGTLDYEMLERVSKIKGRFVYVPQILCYHRISEETDTWKGIQDDIRTKEEQLILERLWPRYIAKLISNKYKKAQKYY